MAKQTEAQIELERLAWERWFARDFSWEGLLRSDLVGSALDDEDNLQDNWRRHPVTGEPRSDDELIAAGELIVAAGQKTYHIAHLPLHYDLEKSFPTVKTTAPKETFKTLWDILVAKIEAQIADQKDEDSPYLIYDLQGCVINSLRFHFDTTKTAAFSLELNDAIVLRRLSLETKFLSYFSADRASFFAPISVNDHDTDASRRNDNFSCYFEECYFLMGAQIWGVKTEVELNFYECRLASGIRAGSSKLNLSLYDTRVAESIELHQCDGREVSFTNGRIEKGLWVSQCRYSDPCDFDGTEFVGRVNFLGSKFQSEASFGNVKFRDSFSFSGCEINRFQFTSITWPDELSKCSRAFERCTFHEMADFTGSGIRAFAAFDSAWFEKGLRLDALSEDAMRATFRSELPKAGADGREELLGQIESGCRSLKQAMEKMSNKPLEQLFYRFELQSRRRQKKTSAAEKFISGIYAHYSDYGASYWRPFYGLASMLALFAVIYGFIGGTFAIPWFTNLDGATRNLAWVLSDYDARSEYLGSVFGKPQDWLISVDFNDLHVPLTTSASRIFPFGAFEDVSKAFADGLSSGWVRLGYRLLATVESFMALTLAFMFGLAVRRRFQID